MYAYVYMIIFGHTQFLTDMDALKSNMVITDEDKVVHMRCLGVCFVGKAMYVCTCNPSPQHTHTHTHTCTFYNSRIKA